MEGRTLSPTCVFCNSITWDLSKKYSTANTFKIELILVKALKLLQIKLNNIKIKIRVEGI